MSDDEDDEFQRQFDEATGRKWNDPVKWFVLDEAGEPVPAKSLPGWERAYGDHKKRIVKQEWIENVRVSTVFLGLDHNYGGGEPILWETMTFSNRKDFEYEMNRCSGSREQAEAMHAKMVERVKARLILHG